MFRLWKKENSHKRIVNFHREWHKDFFFFFFLQAVDQCDSRELRHLVGKKIRMRVTSCNFTRKFDPYIM